MVEVRLYVLRGFPLNQTKPNHPQSPTKRPTKHIQTYVIVSAQLQLQFNLSWCDLNLTLHNNSTPAQPPFNIQTLNMCVFSWSKVIKSSRLFFRFQSTFFQSTPRFVCLYT